MYRIRAVVFVCMLVVCGYSPHASHVNFEVSHVHPIALTPSGDRLLIVNTPDARLEVFRINEDGRLVPDLSIPVGFEPVSVTARTDSEAWVVNHLSDSISIVDLDSMSTVGTLPVGDEPTDVVFAQGKAFVSVSQEDRIKVFDLSNLGAPSTVLDLFGEDPRALAVSPDGQKVYAVVLQSGNRTTTIRETVIFTNRSGAREHVLEELGLNDLACNGSPNPYPPLPAGIERNPDLIDPTDGIPKVGLIVRWNASANRWEDDAGQDWTHCLPFRLPDHDLFVIDAGSLAIETVDRLGTSLFEVSVNPANGRIYVPNTDARNFVRFEHPLGVRGHVVDNQLSIIDPGNANAVTILDLNAHIDRASDPQTNLPEREASISQPGMMVWKSDGSAAYMTAIGSRKVFQLDGGCLSPECVFGPSRATPNAVEVGNGPTGIALLEARNRLYVLNRIDGTVVTVDSVTMEKIAEVELNDPAGPEVRDGRIFLYDGILTSGHGDASCASCHISGDMDGLAWDLGDPTGSLVPYGSPGDNVRFIRQNPVTGDTETCEPPPQNCADHRGFDPQKGPMTTQTLRGMIEPLHWRGDRPTLNAFNPAFEGLLGAASQLSAADMETLRQFLLGIRLAPNPYRNLDDSLPNQTVQIPGHTVAGNPGQGEIMFNTFHTDGFVSCAGCHKLPFGTNGGQLGGISPEDPPDPAWAALHRGVNVLSSHSDLKMPHLRNLYEKFGPVFGEHASPLDAKSGFGFSHDGGAPDLATFLAGEPFLVDAAQIRDISTFVLHFSTGTRPAVGVQVTLPEGPPPTGSPEDENRLAALIDLGDRIDMQRHCELVAHALDGGRARAYRLEGGSWLSDVAGEPAISTTALREGAEGPVTFTCVTIGSGERLGGDRDDDGVPDGDDCAAGDPGAAAAPPQILGLEVLRQADATIVRWPDQSTIAGSYVVYELFGGSLQELITTGIDASSCLAGDLPQPEYTDDRPAPQPGDGHYYLVRSRNECVGSFGPGRDELSGKTCDPGAAASSPPPDPGPTPP